MSVLAPKYRGKLDADDINVIKEFINGGIDVNVFNILTCKTFECFELLITYGYQINVISQIATITYGWECDKLINVVMCVMSDEKTRSRLNLDHEIFHLIDCIAKTRTDEKALCEMAAMNFPEIKISAACLIKFWRYIDILEPFFNFTSQELITEYLKQSNADMIVYIAKYCDPVDYLTTRVFQKVFDNGTQNSISFLMDMGYIMTSDSLPKYFHSLDTTSYDYLKALGLWNGQTFDWETFTHYIVTRQETYDWLRQNHCPEYIIEKIACTKN
jgi:hypothetical protein